MRYEFRQNGTVVGAALWEGPGQVRLDFPAGDAWEAFSHYFEDEAVYLETGFDAGTDGGFQIRRRDWTPWEFERACRALAARFGLSTERVQTGPVEARPDALGAR
jgi:hypothetical protein